MSKIEKALNRSVGERRLVLVAKAATEKGEPSRELVNAPGMGVSVPRLPASETIARMRETQRRSAEELAAAGIISPERGESAAFKAFRDLRTKVLQKTQGRNGVIMITGVSPRCGATFVALNLGAAFAFDPGKTALLIDCNLRDPTLHQLVQGPATSGLTNYLDDAVQDVADIIYPIGVDRLRVIPAGVPRETPGEYFTSAKMQELIESIKSRYYDRFVLLDAPPVTQSADTQILAELCDYVLLVLGYGSVTPSQVERAIKGIDKSKFLGVVFNQEPCLPPIWSRK